MCVRLSVCERVCVCVNVGYPRRLLLSILEAVLTVSPKRQYLGMDVPTTPATTGPDERGRPDGCVCVCLCVCVCVYVVYLRRVGGKYHS